MAPFNRRNYKDIWHRKLASSGAYQCLVGDPSAGGFPFDSLRHATDEYLSKIRVLPGTEACDIKLGEIIAEHVDKEGGAREIALLACLHALTLPTSAAILASFREECRLASSNPRYLQCLTLSHYSCPSLVGAHECQIAAALMQTLTSNDLFSSFRKLIRVIGSATDLYHLPPSYINHLLDTTHFDTFFQSHVDELEQKRKFMTLHNEVSWLRAATGLPPAALVLAIVNAQIPAWPRWTSWKPDYLRLMQWEGGKFTEAQRSRLSHIFDLEGPDVTGHGFGTLKDSVPGCFEHVRVRNQDPAFLDRLLKVLDHAQSASCSVAVDLFIYLCVDNANPVDDDLLALTEAILSTSNEPCIEGMLVWLKSLAPGTGFNDRMVALTKVLPVFDIFSQLRDLVGGDLSSDILDVMRTAQLEYCIQLEIGVAENFGMKIYSFGRAILGTKWIQPSLDPDFLRRLQRFPTEETLKAIFRHAETSQTSTDLMRRYLAGTLGGKDADLDVLLSQLQVEMKYWGAGMDAERMNIAIMVKSLRYIDGRVVAICQERILVEDNLFLQDLLPIIRHDTSSACVNLTRLLGRRRQRRLPVDVCWIELLYHLMKHRGDQLLSWAAETLPVNNFFTFIADLNLLFPGSEPRFTISSFGLTVEKMAWWYKLSHDYATAVQRLEALYSGQSGLKWLFFQQVTNVTVLLEILQARTPPARLHGKILKYLGPSQQAITQVCEALTMCNKTSEVGRQAFESILTRHEESRKTWPRSASEILLVAWGQSRGIQHSDITALNALAELLGLSMAIDNSGFATARDVFLADHARILGMAADLEAIRLTLRSHNASRTSTFLQGLRVEDARGSLDPAIPEDLIDAIEALGDRCYELCFPLTQLKNHKRHANGINLSSRMLLVRVSLQQTPTFCIHFYPDADSERLHMPWQAGRSAPQGIICSTQPTLFTYMLGRAIHSFLTNGQRDLRKLHELVISVLDSRGEKCLMCGTSLGSKLWRPSYCGSCSIISMTLPVEVAASHLLADPPVLDFLLACVYAAAADTTALNLLPECPVPKTTVRSVIDSFPLLPKDTSAAQLLSKIRGNDSQARHRIALLSWLGSSFRGFMLTAPESARVPLMPGVHQFLMLNSMPEREAMFDSCLKAAGIGGSASAATTAGGVVFHGTPATRLLKVLTEGLKNMSNTPFMAHGASHGSGIYLADEPAMSLGYSGSTGVTWKNSAWGGRQVLLGCELAGHTPNSYHVIPNEGRVVIRYVFLCPAGFRPPQARLIDGAMKMTYAALRTGVLA